MKMHSFLLMIVAVTAASASLVRRSDPFTPVTKRGIKCNTLFFVPKCPSGFFCHDRKNCYERIPVGQPCQGETLDCAEPGYCKIVFGSKTPGVCTHRLGVGAACDGPTQDRCAEDLACVFPETEDINVGGKCFAVPLKEGMACNYDEHCGSDGYCYMEGKHKRVGACKPRAQLNQECGSPNSDNRAAAPCGPGLGCYMTEGKNKGICFKNHGGVGAKCYENGGLSCDPNQDLYCKYGPDRSNTVCARGLGLGATCSENLSKGTVCGKGLGCYIEGEFGADGVCLNRLNNPAGYKCNWAVFCGRDTNCSYFPGKNYGVCAKTPSKKP